MGDFMEEGHARPHLHRVNPSEDVRCRQLLGQFEQSPGDFPQPSAQNRMGELSLSLTAVLDSIIAGSVAEPQPFHLRKDVPNPMAPLPAVPYLTQRLPIVLFLCIEESL